MSACLNVFRGGGTQSVLVSVAALLSYAASGGCSDPGDVPCPPGVACDDGPGTGGAGGGGTVPCPPGVACDSGPAINLLCDGDPLVRLAYQVMGGGQTLPGSQVTSENGFSYLLVTGQCHFWVMNSADADVHEGQLADSEAFSLSNTLRLGDWSGLDAAYGTCALDVPSRLLRFRDTRVTISGSCGGTLAAPPAWLSDGIAGSVQDLYAKGTPVAGPVRFLLMTEQGTWSSQVEKRAAAWPLADDPASLALTYEAASRYVAGSSQMVAATDAEELRKLRRVFFDSGGGPFSGGFIPVVGSDGARYELFARDTIPLEDDSGLLHVQ